jgi:hypothetical protein
VESEEGVEGHSTFSIEKKKTKKKKTKSKNGYIYGVF